MKWLCCFALVLAAPCLVQLSDMYILTAASDCSLSAGVSGASTGAAATVIKGVALSSNAVQQWLIAAVDEGRPFTAKHNRRCLDVSEVAKPAGAGPVQWACKDGFNKMWTSSRVASSYQSVNVNNGVCLSIPAGGTKLAQAAYSAIATQLWFLTPLRDVKPSTAALIAQSPGVMPTRAWDFLNSVGVNTHFSYTDTVYYKQPDRVIALLTAAGIRHVRDGLFYSSYGPNTLAIHEKLAAAGIGANLVVPNPSAAITVASLSAALATQPDAESIEAPNEWDQAGGSTWVSTLRAYMPTLQQVAKAKRLPLYGPSLTRATSYSALGNIAAFVDLNSEHNYWGGRNPETKGWGGPNSAVPPHYYGAMEYDFEQSAIIAPGTPTVQTETGYIANDAVSHNIISQATEAIYEPRLLLHSWNMGVKRTYIYELLDEPSSPTGYGLLRSDLTARPAFTALASLLSLLKDTKNAAAVTALQFTLTGAGLEYTLLEKQDGSYWLAIWNPGSVWDVNALKATPVALQLTSLRVWGGHAVQASFQLDDTGTARSLNVSGASVSLSIGSTVTLVSIR